MLSVYRARDAVDGRFITKLNGYDFEIRSSSHGGARILFKRVRVVSTRLDRVAAAAAAAAVGGFER